MEVLLNWFNKAEPVTRTGLRNLQEKKKPHGHYESNNLQISKNISSKRKTLESFCIDQGANTGGHIAAFCS